MREFGMELGTGLPERATRLAPVARVRLGERFAVETDTCCQPVVRGERDVEPERFRERTEVGPIYVEGVEAGDMIRVRLHSLSPIGHASGARYDGKIDFLPIRDGAVRCPGGLWMRVRMMVGVICVAPSEEEAREGSDFLRYDLGDNGGNMDYRDVSEGNAVCFMARHRGGLLFLGDMHAAQGYGEWLGLGAECAGRAELAIEKEMRFRSERPVVLKDGSLACLASRWPLCDALNLAIDDAASIVSQRTGADPTIAKRFALLTGSATHGQNAHLLRKDLYGLERGVMPATVGFEIPTECLGL